MKAIRSILLLALLLKGAFSTRAQNVIAWGNNTYGQATVPASATNVVSVAAGWNHSMALNTNGNVLTWGSMIATPAAVTNITAIAAGALHCLALRADGKVFAWGDNSQGQTNVPSSATNIIAVSAGTYHSLALRANGTVMAWGRNAYGQTNVPAGLTNVVAVAAGVEQSLAMLQDGSITIWGGNTAYPMSGATVKPYPQLVPVAISAASVFNLALLSNGKPYEWGLLLAPQAPKAATNLVAAMAGTNFCMALRTDGRVFAWGAGTVTNPPSSATNVIAIAGGLAHALAVTGNGAPVIIGSVAYKSTSAVGGQLPLDVRAAGAGTLFYQWFTNGVAVAGATNAEPPLYGVLGGSNLAYQVTVSNSFGSITSQPVYFTVNNVNAWGCNVYGQCNVPANLGTPLALAAGAFHCLALESNGTVVAWGKNYSGQTNVPAGLSNVVAIAAGNSLSMVLQSNGTVVEWGATNWSITFSNSVEIITPMPPSVTNVTGIAAGPAYQLALRADGSVIGWGDFSYGQTNPPSYATNAIAIAAGYYHALALLANRSVVSWGSQTIVPPAATNVMAIAAGCEHSLALRADGSVIAWGDNSYGQCSVPANVTNAIAIAAGFGESLAILGDGTLAAWGQNGYVTGSTPVGINNVTAIACGEEHAVAVSAMNAPQALGNPTAIAANVGGTAVLNGNVNGIYPLTWQWYQGGQTVAGATNRWLPLNNLVTTNAGAYTVTASNAVGTALSSAINLTVSPSPYFFPAPPVTRYVPVGTPLNLSISASGARPLSFKSQLNGTTLTDGNGISGTATPFLSFDPLAYADSGTVNLVMTNIYGSYTGLVATLAVTPLIAWGDNSSNQLVIPAGLSNVVAVAAGGDHSVALSANGSVTTWGDNGFGLATIPANATNAVAVTAGDVNSLVLRADGTVIEWGDDSYSQTNVPVSTLGAVQIAAGAYNGEALMPNGTVIGWGSHNTLPAAATNIVSISARGNNLLALRSDGMVFGAGTTATPGFLTNDTAIAIAAGYDFGLALLTNHTVAAWGQNEYGQINVPAAATNVVAITAGDYQSLALRADGTVVIWGYTNINQAATLASLPGIITMAGGSLHSVLVTGDALFQPMAGGGSTVLTAGNLGSGLGKFQWYFDGTAISGATNVTLTLTNFQPANSGTYQVVVSNPLVTVAGPEIVVGLPPLLFDPSDLSYNATNGAVKLRLTGNIATNSVILYASSNLVNWQAIFTNPPSANPITFTDTPPALQKKRFYRALEKP